VGLSENLFKRGVVSGFVEERQSSYAAIQDMIGEVSSSEARAARLAAASLPT
jgi:hypothetical protein